MLYRPSTASATLPSRFPVSAPAKPENRKTRRRNRSCRRHFDKGIRRSARRAFDAAGLYLAGIFPTLAAAAQTCVVAPHYVAAAAVILKVEDPALVSAILDGRVQLLTAAKAMKSMADFISAFRNADAADRFTFTQAVGTAEVWDHLIVPAIDGSGKEVAATHSSAIAAEDNEPADWWREINAAEAAVQRYAP
jgi:hypothetical protein